MGNPCNLFDPKLPQRQQRGKFSHAELSDLTTRVMAQAQKMAALGNTFADDVQRRVAGLAQVRNIADNMWAHNVGRITTLAPNQREYLADWLSRYLGQKNKLLGFSPETKEFSVPGEVRYDLLQAGRVADGIIDIQGKLFALAQTRKLTDTIREIAKARNIRGYNMSEIIYETLESGLADKNASIYGLTPNQQSEISRVVNKWHNHMTDLGFQPDDVDRILTAAQSVGSSFEAMRVAAQAFNIQIPGLENIGYVPREFTPDFRMRVADWANQEKSLFESVNNNPLTMKTLHSKSRSTWKYLPEDTAFMQRLTGLSSDQLNDLYADGVAWRNYLMSQFSDEQMDLLVDSGVMSKLPMTAPEVFEYLVKTYELPYKELNEMFVIDPVKAINSYSQTLQHSIRNSAMLKLIARDGINAGWAVTDVQVRNNPELAGFVKLASIDHPVLSDMMTGSEAKSLYVHPIVAEQLKGLVDLAVSPSQLGNIGKTWVELSGLLKSMFIGSSNVLYVGKQFLSNMVSLQAMGAGVHQFLPAMYDVIRAHQYGLDTFDNVRPYRVMNGQVMTKRQFMEKVFIVRGVPFTPAVPGERPTFVDWNRLNPKNAGRMLNYVWTYANATPYGSPASKGWRAGKYVGNALKDGINEWYHIWAGMASFIDLSARMAAYKSMSSLPGGVGFDTAGQVLTGHSFKRFDDIDELSRYIDDYLPMFDDIGSITATVARFVRPFAAWAMTNLPMQIRHMMRNPGKFYAYNRVVQYITQESVGNEEIAEGEFNAYDLDEYPIVLKRDPNNKQTIILTPTNYDPLLGSVTYLSGLKEGIDSLILGHYPDNTQKQRARVKAELGIDKPLWSQVLLKAAGETYFGPLVEILSGIDPYTGKSVKEKPFEDNTYLGMKMPTALEAVLSLVPPLDALDRWNPLGAFGYRSVMDARTGEVIRPEKLSIFNQRRDRSDATVDDAADKEWQFKAMRMLGMRVRTIDGLSNMQYTYEDTKNLVDSLEGAIKRNRIEIATMPDSKIKTERTKKLEHMIDAWLQFQWDLGRITYWMVQNDVPARQAFDEMRKRQILTEDLPMPGSDFLQEKLKEADQMRRLHPTSK